MENPTTTAPDGDTPEPTEPPGPGGPPRRPVSDLAFASSLLRTGAFVAFVMWLVGVVSAMWFQWSQVDGMSQFANAPEQSRLLAVLVAGFTQTWGYLLVAVTAFAAAAFLAGSGPARDVDQVSTAGVDAVAAPAADDHA
jgi:hypothetical protein